MRPIRRAVLPFVTGLCVLALAILPAFATAQDRPQLSEEAAEADSIPRYRVKDPIASEAAEMTLQEIIARAVEGSRSNLSGHHDVTFNVTLRLLVSWEKKREINDTVYLVYQEEGGFSRVVEVASVERKEEREGPDAPWTPVEDEDDESDFRVRAEEGDDGDLDLVPFYLQRQDDFRFTLLERTLENDHVIFRIAFRPKTDFKPLPSGTVYVDTNAFRIIHEEFTFETNPLPFFLAGVDRVSRQWMELGGGQWVPQKVLGRIRLRGTWMGFIPERAEFAMLFNDYRFDQGYDAHRFGER